MLVAITGGIGSGKTTIANELASRGYLVYNCDERAKYIIIHNPYVRSAMISLFGEEIFEGDVYRTDLVAQQVFHSSPAICRHRLAQLNALVHPAVAQDLRAWVYAHPGHRLLFVETALLLGTPLRNLCDKVCNVVAPEEVCIARVMARDNSSEDQVKARVFAQSSRYRKSFKADLTLHNDGTKPVPELADMILARFLKRW